MHNLYIKGFLTQGRLAANSIGSSIPQLMRMIILMDMQPNGATPLTTDLLMSANPVAQLNLSYRDRFKILIDKVFAFGPYWNTTGATGLSDIIWAEGLSRPYKKFIKLNEEVIFQNSTGNISDITSGALYMFWISSNAGIDGGTFLNSTRVRYSDN